MRKKKESGKTRLLIKSKARLTIAIVLALIAFIYCITTSKTEQVEYEYESFKVGYGDTYWTIAKWLQSEGYKADRDIREVVNDITVASGIPAHELMAGDVIQIPIR